MLEEQTNSNKIVSKSSATYGLPDDKEVVIEISATHSDICRFNKTREDQDRFKLVSNTLEEEYDNIIQQGELSDVSVPGSEDEPVVARFQRLSPPQPALFEGSP